MSLASSITTNKSSEIEALSWLLLRYATSAEYRLWEAKSERVARRAQPIGTGNVPLGAADSDSNGIGVDGFESPLVPQASRKSVVDGSESRRPASRVGSDRPASQDAEVAQVAFESTDDSQATIGWPQLAKNLSLELAARPELRLAVAANRRNDSDSAVAQREYERLKGAWQQEVRRSAAAELLVTPTVEVGGAAKGRLPLSCGWSTTS